MRVVAIFLTTFYVSIAYGVQPTIFGTFENPYNADSPWNSRPVNPVFDLFEIPKSLYYPSISQGNLSVTAFKAASTDPSVTIYPNTWLSFIYDPDSTGAYRKTITIEHWPADVTPASGGDGHADIIDEAAGIVHSFWQLRNTNGIWRATLYSWSPLNGSGFGDPAHYYQGARAVGIPASAGVIRQHEINDNNSLYYHALAMSLTYNALSANPAYQFPATAADGNASKTNTGVIPEGALFMLPSDFDKSKIKSPGLIKVINTLQTYGAYVVDQNYGTPFYIYVENGPVKFPFNILYSNGKWNNVAAEDLQTIRAGLRLVTGADYWLNGNNKKVNFNEGVNKAGINILSLRGPWTLDQKTSKNATLGSFDSLRQSVIFGASSAPIIQYKIMNASKISNVIWGQPVVGDKFIFTAHSTNNAKVRIQFSDKSSGKSVFDSGDLSNGQSVNFDWPDGNNNLKVFIASGIASASSASATLVKKIK